MGVVMERMSGKMQIWTENFFPRSSAIRIIIQGKRRLWHCVLRYILIWNSQRILWLEQTGHSARAVNLIVQKAIIDKQYNIMQLNLTLFEYTNEILGV